MSKIGIERYRPELLKTWDQFVLEESLNGTFLHTKQFYEYHKDRFTDHSFMFFDKSKLLAVLPAAIEGKSFKSHPGCTFAGFVLSQNVTISQLFEFIELLEANLTSSQLVNISFTLPPATIDLASAEMLEYVLDHSGYKHIVDATQTVFVSKIDNEQALLASYRGSTRNQTRQAIKSGLNWQLSDDYTRFWDILNQNLEDRHETKPVHTLEEMQWLVNKFPNHIRLLGIYKDDYLIGGTVLFDYGRVLHTQYIAMDYEFYSIRPGNMIYHAVLCYALQGKYDYVGFGVSSEYFGGPLNEGLFSFKEGFGATPVTVKRYHKQIGYEKAQ